MIVFREIGRAREALFLGGDGAQASEAPARPTVLNLSMPTPIGRYFFTVRFGRERRTIDRLVDEGQISIAKVSLAYTLAMWSVLGLVGLGVMVGMYILKSFAGINLMDGPSFLHNFLYR